MPHIAASQIDQSVLVEIENLIRSFSVGFVGIEHSSAKLLGSGTLVEVDGKHAILTAAHVIEVLPRHGRLGLILSNQPGAPSIDATTLTFISIPRDGDEHVGPDLGVVLLPNPLPSSLSGKKAFVNLRKRQQRMIESPPELGLGLWSICGFQAHLTSEQIPIAGYDKVYKFQGYCPVGWIESSETVGRFDYLIFPMPHGNDSPMPDSIGGTSGAGLWQVLLTENAGIKVQECLLSGVAFYQGEIVDNTSLVRCHGHNSIYRDILDIVAKSKVG